LASSGVSFDLLDVSFASSEGLVDSLDSCVVPEGGSALVLSTSPPGDWYWLTHAHSEQPIRVIRSKE